jgi:DNA helicase INO80
MDKALQKLKVNGDGDIIKPVKKAPRQHPISDKDSDILAALANIEEMELSDIDIPEFEEARTRHKERSQKRMLELEQEEFSKRKVNRIL